MKILVIGPSPTKSKGGMATVIEEIQQDKILNEKFEIEVYESYIDGNKLKVLLFSLYAFVRFYFTKKNYDLYHVHTASYGSAFRKSLYVRAAKKWGKKVILHIHGAEYMVFYRGLSPKRQERLRGVIKMADMVLALSEHWKQIYVSEFGLTNCFVLKNGIDMERLRPAACDPAVHQSGFAALGRLGERKGTYDLIEALDIARKKIPAIKCYLAGDGEVKKVQELVKTRNLEGNVEVMGWVNFQEKLHILGSVSTVVLPSYHEGLPMSVLEGMACGKAIVSTWIGGIPEVVGPENGILIGPGDIPALANAMIRCCTDAPFMRTVCEKNIKKIDQSFSMKKMHEQLAGYYDELSKSSKSGDKAGL